GKMNFFNGLKWFLLICDKITNNFHLRFMSNFANVFNNF
ncbi:hypothetical protein NT06LI_0726, partial [Listeria innocua FSL J1-023]